MYRKFVNARSPLRLLEKGLHGGLGAGNVGLVLAGHGVGKTPFLVGVALDEALRGGNVLHVALDQTVAHVKLHYDAVFDDFAATTHLDDVAVTRGEIDRRRNIRAYTAASFSAAKLREAAKVEAEAGSKPAVILVEGVDVPGLDRAELLEMKSLAGELGAEIWLSVATEAERVKALPAAVRMVEDAVSVILALEPDAGTVALRALKDHENPDVSALHVALDPSTLLLVRS